MFVKGDILLPSSRVARKEWLDGLFHPAVVWDDNYSGENDFRGIMITHCDSFNNILMNESHFEAGHEIGFSNSHFVNRIFVKFQYWGPFELVGKLTPDGIDFIEDQLTNNDGQIEFTTYRAEVINEK
ncbi:hypothetical protein [Sphingobacterium spiritivorum]